MVEGNEESGWRGMKKVGEGEMDYCVTQGTPCFEHILKHFHLACSVQTEHELNAVQEGIVDY